MAPIPPPSFPESSPSPVFEGLTADDLGPDAKFFEVDDIPIASEDGDTVRFDRVPPTTFPFSRVIEEGTSITKDEFLALVRKANVSQA